MSAPGKYDKFVSPNWLILLGLFSLGIGPLDDIFHFLFHISGERFWLMVFKNIIQASVNVVVYRVPALGRPGFDVMTVQELGEIELVFVVLVRMFAG